MVVLNAWQAQVLGVANFTQRVLRSVERLLLAGELTQVGEAVPLPGLRLWIGLRGTHVYLR